MPLAAEDQPTQWYAPQRRPAADGVASISLRLRESTRPGRPPEEGTVPGHTPSDDPRQQQRMLWVDGVGGYLVSLAEDLLIGQPAAPGAAGPGLAILADLSRRHARLSRTGGSYVLTPLAEVTVDGRAIDGPTVLKDGALIGLGDVRLSFSRPHALSASGLLAIESGHRTTPAADAVLMMAESCILGPKPHSHIRCPDWQGEAILFRGGDQGLVCRAGGGLLVDGTPTDGPAPVSPGKRIEGQDFALCVEEVGET